MSEIEIVERSSGYWVTDGTQAVAGPFDSVAEAQLARVGGDVEERRLLRISSAAHWYEDPEWLKWLNSPGTATWHHSGEEADEFSDVFVHVCGREGSDEPGYDRPAPPPYIWNHICDLVEARFGKDAEALVWISNEIP